MIYRFEGQRLLKYLFITHKRSPTFSAMVYYLLIHMGSAHDIALNGL